MPDNIASFYVSEKAEKSVRGGHPWIYGEEVISVSGEYEQGQIVSVFTKKGSWLGKGFVNDSSKIRVRLISRNTNDTFDEAFWTRRIKYAVEYRKHIFDNLNTCRLIYGEADGFPGFTVDKYEDMIVTQVLSLGVEKIKDMLYRILFDVLKSEGYYVRDILERCDVPVREKEGLTQYKRFYEAEWLTEAHRGLDEGERGKVKIEENGIVYEIDCYNGQKTGYFLDQKLNRVAAGKISEGLNVLDCFCNIGGFSFNCAVNGAKSVTGVDISELACETGNRGAEINGLTGKVHFEKADVFELLTDLASSKKKPYEMIILDPPAFTKSRETRDNAYKGYKDINFRAMKALPRGGYLVSCSCSHFMTEEMFERMLLEAANDASVQLRLVEKRLAAPDHPVLFGVPETEYLKFYIMQVV